MKFYFGCERPFGKGVIGLDRFSDQLEKKENKVFKDPRLLGTFPWQRIFWQFSGLFKAFRGLRQSLLGFKRKSKISQR